MTLDVIKGRKYGVFEILENLKCLLRLKFFLIIFTSK